MGEERGQDGKREGWGEDQRGGEREGTPGQKSCSLPARPLRGLTGNIRRPRPLPEPKAWA